MIEQISHNTAASFETTTLTIHTLQELLHQTHELRPDDPAHQATATTVKEELQEIAADFFKEVDEKLLPLLKNKKTALATLDQISNDLLFLEKFGIDVQDVCFKTLRIIWDLHREQTLNSSGSDQPFTNPDQVAGYVQLEKLYVGKADFFEISRSFAADGTPVLESPVRLREADQATEAVKSGKKVLITGPNRIGKTSMLYAIAERTGGTDACVFFDGTMYSSYQIEKALPSILYDLADQFAKQIVKLEQKENADTTDSREEEISSQLTSNSKNTLNGLLEAANTFFSLHNKTVFLALDEITSFFFNDPNSSDSLSEDAIQMFAQLKTQSHIHLGIVLHRFPQLETVLQGRFSGEDFSALPLQPLTLEEVRALITKAVAGKIEFTDSAIQAISDFSGGRPLEVQVLASALTSPFSSISPKRALITAESFRQIASASTVGELGQEFYTSIRNYERIFKLFLTVEQQDLVWKIAINKQYEITQKMDLPRLRELGIITGPEDALKIQGQLLKNVILRLTATHEV